MFANCAFCQTPIGKDLMIIGAVLLAIWAWHTVVED